MMQTRIVQAEQLDQLPHDDAVAARIHRDIHRFNRLMGNFHWIAETLRGAIGPGDRVLEIAAGRGRLLRFLADRGVIERAARVAAFDASCPRPVGCPEQVEWSVCRAEEFPDYASFNVVISCHFLHQLEDSALRRIGRQIRHADLICAAEPRRHQLAHLLCRSSALIGFSRAGIGDGLTSIRAGFRGRELPQISGFDGGAFQVRIVETCLGRYGMVVRRIEASKRGDLCI